MYIYKINNQKGYKTCPVTSYHWLYFFGPVLLGGIDFFHDLFSILLYNHVE